MDDVRVRIPSARVAEIPGAGHLAFGKPAMLVVDEIERFVKDVWEAGGWEESEPDRMLTTVLFTRFGAPAPSSRACERSGSRSARGSTQASASS